MNNNPHFIVVDSQVLPEVFEKVLEVKKIMAHKEEKAAHLRARRQVFQEALITSIRIAFFHMRKCLQGKLLISTFF